MHGFKIYGRSQFTTRQSCPFWSSSPLLPLSLPSFHFALFHFFLLIFIFQKKEESWKKEYKKAYRCMALRYMGGANLQQSKVVHFGPTLGKEKRERGEKGGRRAERSGRI